MQVFLAILRDAGEKDETEKYPNTVKGNRDLYVRSHIKKCLRVIKLRCDSICSI